MKLLSPQQVSELTGLPYGKSLALVKLLNHIQIDRRYYVSEDTLRSFLNPSEPILVTTTQQEE